MWAFFSRFTRINSMISMFNPGGQSYPPRKAEFWFNLIGKCILFVLVVFVFIWWPVTTYTPEGFDQWSLRMAKLPDEVWYLILIIMASVGASQIVGQMKGRHVEPMTVVEEEEEIDFLSEDAPPISRFGVSEDEPDMFTTVSPNPVIEDWKRNNG